MDFYYSTTMTPFGQGKRFKNPQGFWKVDLEATKVYVVGDWPRVVQKYEAANIPVVVIKANDRDVLYGGGEIKSPDVPVLVPAAPTPTAERRAQQSAVVIPEGWEQMPWADLRRLAASVTDQPVVNKAQATAAIRNELALREEKV